MKKIIIVKLVKLVITGFIMLKEIVLMIHMHMKNIIILIIMKLKINIKNVMKDVGDAMVMEV